MLTTLLVAMILGQAEANKPGFTFDPPPTTRLPTPDETADLIVNPHKYFRPWQIPPGGFPKVEVGPLSARVERVAQPKDRYVDYVTMELTRKKSDGKHEAAGKLELPAYSFEMLTGDKPAPGATYQLRLEKPR